MTVKVYVRTSPAIAHRERVAHEHLSTLKSSHPGRSHIREDIDCFSLQQCDGSQHLCFVYQPLQTTLLDLQRLGGKPQQLPEELVKEALRYLLEALDFLHTEASMIHCGISSALVPICVNVRLTSDHRYQIIQSDVTNRRFQCAFSVCKRRAD